MFACADCTCYNSAVMLANRQDSMLFDKSLARLPSGSGC